MNLLLADTFNSALGKLAADEQRAVKVTVFDFQQNPDNPGHSFHRIERAKDKNFWSVRVNRDIRLIVNKRGDNLLVCYVDHHDKAYAWAQSRRLENHPKTGVAQIVQIRETIRDIEIPNYVKVEAETSESPSNAPFKEYSDDDLLQWGVPIDWLNDVREADDNQLLSIVALLPSEAGDALLELATGGTPNTPEPVASGEDPFNHPDAQRRFQLIHSDKELEAALEFPWDKWSVFLHPDQRKLVTKSYNGPARVSGSAGTGKTIVALHRAAHLARENEDALILLTTFSPKLAKSLASKLNILVYHEPLLRERIAVRDLETLAQKLYEARIGRSKVIGAEEINELIQTEYKASPPEVQNFSPQFLKDEWHHIIDAHQIQNLDEYLEVSRLGRRSRLSGAQRETLWPFFEGLQQGIAAANQVTREAAYTKLAENLRADDRPLYDHAIIDEAQDLSVSQLKFFAALGNSGPESLFFAGDIGQRIFLPPFSWFSQGIDIRGRSSTLKVNYRTSHQIRKQADLLLDAELEDPDGIKESRRQTISIFNGPEPVVQICDSLDSEIQIVRQWLTKQQELEIKSNEIALVVRGSEEIPRAAAILDGLKLEPQIVLMHDAKGLEFRSVAIIACDEDVIPLQSRVESA
ncbi:MAG: UvrD-helicase domain-containing protein, partial [Verrucomicrobiota bacterium]